ncbi:hypothetical protein ACQEVF_47530 [Nonomuraea polychroma]|uniref:hypothetical protein n=1 Tax=Nonomuraea polychroma TaxID=46176 RepID=UPI003D8A8EFF
MTGHVPPHSMAMRFPLVGPGATATRRPADRQHRDRARELGGFLAGVTHAVDRTRSRSTTWALVKHVSSFAELREWPRVSP